MWGQGRPRTDHRSIGAKPATGDPAEGDGDPRLDLRPTVVGRLGAEANVRVGMTWPPHGLLASISADGDRRD